MKLVACPRCHAQYDLSARPEGGSFACRCGQTLEAKAPTPRIGPTPPQASNTVSGTYPQAPLSAAAGSLSVGTPDGR